MKKLALILVTVLIIITVLLFGVSHWVNDTNIPVVDIAGSSDRVLVVVAHPDDEIMVSGTLAKLNDKGIETGLIYLTRGEAGPTGGLVEQSQLGDARTKEVLAIKDILGVDYLKVFDFPDSGVPSVSENTIKQALIKAIEAFSPTVIIGFDETIGLYGHEDHRHAGLYLHQVLKASKPEGLKDYYMITLPKPMIDLALNMSDMFRERYAKDPKNGLPPADVAVKMWDYAPYKKAVLMAHKTQWEVINDVQPYGMVAPAYLYYGIFDREYFHKVDL